MLNSLKQMLRRPWRSALFFLLLTFSVALLMLGANLWADTEERIDQVEESFTTLVQVQQNGTVHAETNYIEYFNAYISHTYRTYDEWFQEEELWFEEADYLTLPKKRPYYIGYSPAFEKAALRTRNPQILTTAIIEFMPEEDCVPSEPVPMKVVRVLYGDVQNKEEIYFSTFFDPNPTTLEAGKHYIAELSIFSPQIFHPGFDLSVGRGYYAIGVPFSSQYQKDGTWMPMKEELPAETYFEEVTEGFYETERGKAWLGLAEAHAKQDGRYHILPTDSLELLPSFQNKTTVIKEGRAITKEEFERGDPVCLVHNSLLLTGEYEIGDRILLEPAEAEYGKSISDECPTGRYTVDPIVNAEGKPFEPFWSAEYEIVGSYMVMDTQIDEGEYELGSDILTFIVPQSSIKASDENNIRYTYTDGYRAPFLAATTTFLIPNGSIDEFVIAFRENVAIHDKVELIFNDNGYSAIIKSLDNMRRISLILFAIGLAAAIVVIILLLYFFVVQEKKRTAIERSLGMTKRKCMISLLAGILVLSILGIVAGCIGSTYMMHAVQEMDLNQADNITFSLKYSLWEPENAEGFEMIGTESRMESVLNIAIPAGLMLFIFTLGCTLVYRNLKSEPMPLLGSKEE